MHHRRTFFKYVIPSIIAFALSGVYAIIDGFFVGNTIGDMGLSAINMAYPVVALIQAVGTGIGMGAAVYYAIHLASGDKETAENFAGMAWWLLILSSIILSFILYFFAMPLLKTLGMQKELLRYGMDYIQIIALGALLQVLGTGLIPLMRNYGGSFMAMIAMVSGFITNIALDYLFVWQMGYGIKGAGKKANALDHVVLLDPVGAGASALRTNTANDLLKAIHFSVIRGNISEIKTLVLGSGTTKGVDADVADAVTKENLDTMVQFAKDFAQTTDSIIAITGAIDLVADSDTCYVIYNGRKEMGKITGTGCQLSGMTTAFVTANPDHALEAVAASVCTMGLAGEIAWRHMEASDGNATYRNRINDAIYHMDGATLEKGAKYEIR